MKINSFEKNNLNFICLDNGNLKITLCNLGASIFSIYFDDKLMTMTNENIEDFKLPNIYQGKSIGRVANRIKGNTICINNKQYIIKNNEGLNTLHGGVDGLSNKYFTYKIIEGKKSTRVVFSYGSPDKESGFPGRLNVKISYIVFEKTNKFRIKFEAKTTKPTLCSLTNHAFFTLGETSLDLLFLKVNASRYVECGVDDLIPLCEKEVSKSLDFRKYKLITKDIAELRYGKQNGYDHCLLCDENLNLNLKSKFYLLKIKSNFNSCQIYTDNWPNDSIKWVNLPTGTNRSIAIEPQDSILNKEILRPKEKYSRFITYEFKHLK